MPVRSANGDVSTVVDGAAQIGVTAIGAPVLRHWFNRWGTDPDERTAPMPGDELVPYPKLGYTRGITIGAPAGGGVALAGADRPRPGWP